MKLSQRIRRVAPSAIPHRRRHARDGLCWRRVIDLNSEHSERTGATPVVECWLDYSSPFAYLGSTQIERVARESGGRALFRPFLLGALFKEIGTPMVPLDWFGEAKRGLMSVNHFGPMRSMPQAKSARGKAR